MMGNDNSFATHLPKPKNSTSATFMHSVTTNNVTERKIHNKLNKE
jgi:hypothetical protein